MTNPASARAVGQYRPDDALAVISVDRDERLTCIRIPSEIGHAARWVDWLLRAYFGSALLTGGWLLLHTAAVAFDGRVVLLGGAPGAGKSSLAHLLCRDLGAAFLADDLVFVTDKGQSIQAVGWPTRVSLPVALAEPFDGAVVDSRQVSPTWHRERQLAGPDEYCARYGFARAGQGRIVAVLLLDDVGDRFELGQLAADDAQVAFMTDRFGLVGCPDLERHGQEPDAITRLLERVSLLRLSVDRVRARTTEQIWPLLCRVLEKEQVS